MKIYKNENNEFVIDGDGITSIIVPNEITTLKEVDNWLERRIKLPDEKEVILKGFIFKWDW